MRIQILGQSGFDLFALPKQSTVLVGVGVVTETQP